MLTTDHEERKQTPMCTGVLDYFPDALAEVARCSVAGNVQHGLGPLHWDKSKSTDEADALMRHLADRGTVDERDGIRHSAKVAWRALALLQRELDAEKEPKRGIEVSTYGDTKSHFIDNGELDEDENIIWPPQGSRR